MTIDKEYNFAYTVDSTGTTIIVDLTPMGMSAVTLTRTDTTDSGDSGSSSDSSGTTDDTAADDLSTAVTLSGLPTDAPGTQVYTAAAFADLTTSSTVTLTVVCTTYSSSNTWYCYSVDGSAWTENIEWSNSVGTSGGYTADITGDNITSLKSNGLYVYGSDDAVATLTVTVS